MKTRFKDERQKAPISEWRSMDGEDLGNEPEQLKDAVQIFRDSLRAAAERPDIYWMRQRTAISGNLRHHAHTLKWRPALLWAPVSIVILVCFFLFTDKTKLPAPDFAAGADHSLLVGVEQALYQDIPEALAPAAALVQEIK
jgi:hypothetical protein